MSTPKTAVPAREMGADLDGDYQVILDQLGRYFDGLHRGDPETLASVFHADAVLKAPGLRRALPDWLALVASRPRPEDRGDPFDYRVLSIEIVGDQAMAKVYCPLLGRRFIDFLGFLREDGIWRIVNKMYADQPEQGLA